MNGWVPRTLLATALSACSPGTDQPPPAAELQAATAAAPARDTAHRVRGEYTDGMRGFAIALPGGVSLRAMDDSTRLLIERDTAILVVVHVVQGSADGRAYGAAQTLLRDGCIMDTHEFAGLCPDANDHEESAEEGFTGAGMPFIRFHKNWVLVDSTGASERREIGPYWIVELEGSRPDRVLLFRRQEPGLHTVEEIGLIEELVRRIRPVAAG